MILQRSRAALRAAVDGVVQALCQKHLAEHVRVERLENRTLLSQGWAVDGPVFASEGEPLTYAAVPPASATGQYTYLWVAKRDGAGVASSTSTQFTFTPDDQGAYQVELTVVGGTEPVPVQLPLTVQNVAPTAEITGPTDVRAGRAIVLGSTVSEPGGSADSLTYSWEVRKSDGTSVTLPANTQSNLSTFRFVPLLSGGYRVTLTVSDEDGGTTTATHTFTAGSFSPAGVVVGTADFGSLNGLTLEFKTLVRQPGVNGQDDKFIAAGFAKSGSGSPPGYPLLARFNSDLTVDTTFGYQGLVYFRDPSTSVSHPFDTAMQSLYNLNLIMATSQLWPGIQDGGNEIIAVQPDGKILVAGRIDQSTRKGPGVVRLDRDGQGPDTSFGTNGAFVMTSMAYGNNPIFGKALLLQPIKTAGIYNGDYRILLGGTDPNYATSISQGGFLVIGVTGNGTLDTTFGRSDLGQPRVGYWLAQSKDSFGTPIINLDRLQSLTLDANYNIILGGTRSQGGTFFCVGRLTADGDTDRTFGPADPSPPKDLPNAKLGFVSVDVSGQELNQIHYDALNKHIYAAGGGSGQNATTGVGFSVIRISDAGLLDTAFANNGILNDSFGWEGIGAKDIAQQPNGSIIVVGADGGGTNEALNRTATATSEASSFYGPAKAVDSTTNNTYWMSAANAGAPQWIEVDLGAFNVAVSEVKIDWQSGYHGYNFRVLISNDRTNWDEIDIRAANGSATTIHTSTKVGQHLRIVVDAFAPGQSQCAIKHIHVKTNRDLALAQYLMTGAPDPNFGSNGRLLIDVANRQPGTTLSSDIARALILEDDTILVGGNAVSSSVTRAVFVLARYRPDTASAEALVAGVNDRNTVDLRWEDAGHNEEGFVVERSLDNENFVPIAYLPEGTRTYTDEAVRSNTTYYYRVHAFTGYTKRGQSNVAHATTASNNQQFVIRDVVTVPLTGAVAQSSITLAAGLSYRLRATGNFSLGAGGLYRADAEHVSYRADGPWYDSRPGAGQVNYGIDVRLGSALQRPPYFYWGEAATDDDRTYIRNYVPATSDKLTFRFRDDNYPDNVLDQPTRPLKVEIYYALPGAPLNLVATADREAGDIILNWQPNGTDETGFVIERQVAGGAWTEYATVPGGWTTYTDTQVQENIVYAYRVRAQTDAGVSEPSAAFHQILITNRKPVIEQIGYQQVAPNQELLYRVRATDPESNTDAGLTYALTSNSPEIVIGQGADQMWIDAQGFIHGWRRSSSGGSYSVTVTVTDALGLSETQSFSVSVADPAPGTPTLTASTAVAADAKSITLSAIATVFGDDLESNLVYTWSTLSKPSLTAPEPRFEDNNTNTAKDTVAIVGAAGVYKFRVLATDLQGRVASAVVTVTVSQVLSRVVITPDERPYFWGRSGLPIDFSARAVDQFENDVPSATLTWTHESISYGGTMDGGFPGSTATTSNNGTVRYTTPSSTTAFGGIRITATTGSGVDQKSGSVLIHMGLGSNRDPRFTQLPDVQLIDPTTIALTALGDDDGGAYAVTYTWTYEELIGGVWTDRGQIGTPNGTPAARTATASFMFLPGSRYRFKCTIKDAAGLSDAKWIEVWDNTPPHAIAVSPQNASVKPSQPGGITIHAHVTDRIGRRMAKAPDNDTDSTNNPSWSFTFTTPSGSQIVAADQDGKASYTYTPSTVGVVTVNVETSYVNSAGATQYLAGQTTITVANDVAPTVMITGLAIEPPQLDTPEVISKDTDVLGVAIDSNNDLTEWTLDAVPLGQPNSRIRIARGSTAVGNTHAGSKLGTIPVLSLPNGIYTLELIAKDAGNRVTKATKEVEIRSDFKLGGFSLPVADFAVPVSGGLPIVVSRHYDSTTASIVNGDFGPGWRLDGYDLAMRTTARFRPDGRNRSDLPGYYEGDRIDLTLPGGQVHSFQFMPLYNNSGDSLGKSALINFVQVSGTGSRLTLDPYYEDHVIKQNDKGEFVLDEFSTGAPKYFNPAHDAFGGKLVLTLQDQTKYVIDAKTGRVDSITGPTGATLAYTKSTSSLTITSRPLGSVSSDGAVSVTLTRDANGRITSATDPSGNAFNYHYDSAGRLARVYDRDHVPTGGTHTTTPHIAYGYGQQNMTGSDHWLTSVTDARGVKLITAEYTFGGILTKLSDVTGKQSPVSTSEYDRNTIRKLITDPAGNRVEQYVTGNGYEVREIREVRDEAGALLGYSVTVTRTARYPADVSQETYVQDPDSYHAAFRVWATYRATPLFVSGTDHAGERYTRPPVRWAEVTNYSKQGGVTSVRRDVPVHRMGELPKYPQFETTYAEHDLQGRPGSVTDMFGNVSRTEYDDFGNVRYTFNALGEGREAVYSHTIDPTTNQPYRADLPEGLLLQRWRVWDHDGSSATAPQRMTAQPDSSSDYYGAVEGYLLKSSTDAAGVTMHYTYDANGNVLLIYRLWVDPHDSTNRRLISARNTYDNSGRVTLVTNATYKDLDADGELDTTEENENNRANGTEILTTETHYDLAGQVDWTKDEFGRTTYMQYDIRGQLVQTLYPDGTVTRTTYDALGRAEWTTERYVASATDNTTTAIASKTIYDTLGRAVGSERRSGVLISIGDDPAGGGIKTSDENITGSTVLSTTSTTYDTQGRVAKQTGADGQSTHYAYNTDGSVKSTTDALGNSTRGESHRVAEITVSGTVEASDFFQITLIDPYDQTKYAFIEVTAVAGDTPATVAQKLADAINASTHATATQVSAAIVTGGTLRLAAKAGNWYFGAEVLTKDIGATPADTQTFTHTWVRQEHSIDADGNRTINEYDAVGRVGKTVYADGSFTETFYSVSGAWVPGHDLSALSIAIPQGGSQRVQVEQRNAGDPAVATSYIHDARGQLVNVVMPDPDGAGPLGKTVWRYAYDADGNQTKIVDPRSGVTHADYNPTGKAIETTFRYDEQGRRTRRTLPEGQYETWSYDTRGRTHVHVDFKGQSSRYEYYPDTHQHAGELKAEHRYDVGVDPITGTASERTEYDYDALGRRSIVREYAGSTLTRTTTYAFDPITGGTTQVASPEGTINYAYDPATGRHTRTWTSQNDTTYAYDLLGRLETVTATKLDGQAVNLVTTYAYDQRGSLKSVTLPSGITTTYTYDALGRLELEEVKRGSTFVASYDYVLESDGQRDQVIERIYSSDGSTFNQTTIDWTYDGWDRLVAEDYDSHDNSQDFLDEYVYDPVGNRLTKRTDRGRNGTWDATTTYRYGSVDAGFNLTSIDGNDRLMADRTVDGATTTTTTYGYDANGSTTSKTTNGSTTIIYRYDLRNRMVGLDQNGDGDVTDTGDGTLTYDHTGIRVGKHVVGSDAVVFLVDARNHTGYQQVLQEINGSTGATTLSYLIGLDLIAQAAGTTPRYFIYDGHGSTRMLADAAGAIVLGSTYSYDAFGVAIGFATGTAATKMLYSGEQYDSTLGQQYLRARYYSEGIGRFSSFDQYPPNYYRPGTIHRFTYVENRPTTFIDPTGQFGLVDSLVSASINSILASLDGKRGIFAMKLTHNMLGLGLSLDDAVFKAVYDTAVDTAQELATSFFIGSIISVGRTALTYAGKRAFGWVRAVKGSGVVPPGPIIKRDPSRLIPGTPGTTTGGSSIDLKRNMLRDSGVTDVPDHQAHHLIPKSLIDHPLLKSMGMDLDHATNGLMLPTDVHNGWSVSHFAYNGAVTETLNKIPMNLSLQDKMNRVYEIQAKLADAFSDGAKLLENSTDIGFWRRKLNDNPWQW